MFELIFAVIGVASIFWFLFLLGQDLYQGKYYEGLLGQLYDVCSKIYESDKEIYSKKDVSDIVGLLYKRITPSAEYFEKKADE